MSIVILESLGNRDEEVKGAGPGEVEAEAESRVLLVAGHEGRLATRHLVGADVHIRLKRGPSVPAD